MLSVFSIVPNGPIDQFDCIVFVKYSYMWLYCIFPYFFRLGEGWEDAVHREPLTEAQELDPPPTSNRLSGEPEQGPENPIRNKMRRSVAQRLPGKKHLKVFRSKFSVINSALLAAF